jgi:hypothetical protein
MRHGEIAESGVSRMTSPFNTPAMRALRKPVMVVSPKLVRPIEVDPQPVVIEYPPAMGRPFATPAMRDLKRRARRRTSLDTLRVWNNNEGPDARAAVRGDAPQVNHGKRNRRHRPHGQDARDRAGQGSPPGDPSAHGGTVHNGE